MATTGTTPFARPRPVIILLALAVILLGIVALLIFTPRAAGLTVDPLKPDLSVSSSQANKEHQLSAQAARGLTSMPWKFVQLSPDKGTLTVQFVAGDSSCVFPAGYHIVDTSKGLELFMLSTTKHESSCGSSLVTAVGEIKLNPSLGDKSLLHAPVAEGWSHGHFF
ncbi:hypothetical protein [Frondihabitans sp. PAMC 28766]|uniref:hypothetical protein n=1 Tax=Frondihabitans sp. PAMC 28766 TaxID=1795630 RepID=UPI0012FF69B5|nr:hypothetical protein [Frondihabitans sp. PAMC 28766]